MSVDILKHRAKVHKDVASLPGSRDRFGGPIVVIAPPPPNINVPHRSLSSSELHSIQFPYEELVSLLGYFSDIPDQKSIDAGFTILIDGRKSNAKILRTMLRGCQQALYKKIRQALIVQPDKFLNQQRINIDLILEGFEFKTQLVSVHKLSKYIDINQLPENFGGTFSYNAVKWCEERLKIERVLAHLNERRLDFTTPQQNAAVFDEENEESFKKGQDLISDLKHYSGNADLTYSIQRIENAIDSVKKAARRPELEAIEQKLAVEKSERNKLLEDHAEGVNRLLDWIEGPGEKWLETLHEIGESRDEARQLVKEHHNLREKTKEVTTQADELAETATRLMAAAPEHAITLEKSRDQVRALAGQYMNRVERQLEMVQRSEEFHQLMGELSRKTDLLLESLCTDPAIADLAVAEAEKSAVEEKVSVMDKIYEQVAECGSSFVEDLAASEKIVHGRRSTRDYTPGIIHLRDQLMEAKQRRKRCLELVDVRRLKLQQLIQLFTCENDAQQAIKWLDELHDTLLKDYNQIGCDEEDLQCLREDRMKLEETARSTYEYGKQLCQVALVLRRSLRLDVHSQVAINDKLEQTWGRLCRALSENEAKLNVTDAFNTTVVEITRRIDELEKRLKDSLMLRRSTVGSNKTLLPTERKRLASDVKELRHIADMLSAQVNANHSAPVSARQAAVAGILRKVEDVEDRQRRMESLVEEEPPKLGDRVFVRSTGEGLGSIRLSDTESYL